MSDKLYVTARLKAKPEKTEQLKQLLSNVVVESRRENGCLEYGLYQATDDPSVFTTIEVWSDAVSEEAHWDSPHVKLTLEALPDVLDGDALVGKYTATGPVA